MLITLEGLMLYGSSELDNKLTKVRKIICFLRKTNHMFFTENEVFLC